jgi:hypothetical protein
VNERDERKEPGTAQQIAGRADADEVHLEVVAVSLIYALPQCSDSSLCPPSHMDIAYATRVTKIGLISDKRSKTIKENDHSSKLQGNVPIPPSVDV